MLYDNEYEYDYHNLAENSEDIYPEDECYYNDGTDESWMGLDEDENSIMDSHGWDNYYHNLTDEIIDD